ncbi:A1 cistron-splicing factor [Chytriomyces cf. hyalinus JEL632]|nr:A1 cistron-splicing factor [Chytriomyces cf. hyalinus JEL632]
MNIEPELAKQLLATGAMMLLMDAPVNLGFGIDLNEWQTGPRFKGLKLIPPGFHFVFYSSKSTVTGESGIRTGFFKFFDPKEIHVVQWDAANEDIMDEKDLDKDQIQRLRFNIMEFEPNLGAYPLMPHPQQPVPTFQKWLRLTHMITKPLIRRMLPTDMKVSSLVSVSRFSDLDARIVSESDGAATASYVNPAGSNDALLRMNIQFTPIDLKRSFPPNATPDQITKYWFDKSYLLSTALSNHYHGDYRLLLGELQFSFVLFLVGQVYDGLEQWKCLVQMICASKEALKTYRATLFMDFLDVLYSQVTECPQDFFTDALSSSNFLRAAIVDLVANMRDPDSVDQLPNPKLEAKLAQFVKLVSDRFEWDVEEAVRERWAAEDMEEEEFAPVVVE